MQAIFFNPPISKNFLGHQVAEIYKDGIFRDFMKKGMTVLDIGANIGVTTYYFSQFAKKVYSIEPSMEHFEVLSKMVEYNELKNVQLHKLAVYMDNKKRDFFRNDDNRTMNSLIKTKEGEKETVQCVTLDKFFKDNKIEHIDLMKIDIEGSEAEVIGSEGFRLVADKIDTIIMELHVKADGLTWTGRNPNQTVQALKSKGFTVSKMPSDANIVVARR